MRLGFCGVGRWAQKLAAAFRACGAEIVAHDRSRPPELDYARDSVLAPGFGQRISWRNQLADKSIDAIVAVAPPEITTEVAMACAEAGKPVMATKPLFDHPATIRAPFYVDFWRLYSKAHALAKKAFRGGGGELDVQLFGSGPLRGFPGAFDYGPHVMAALLDIAPGYQLGAVTDEPCASGELFRGDTTIGDQRIMFRFGNGAPDSERRIGVDHEWWVEAATGIGGEAKSDVLQRFCQSFLNDIHEGFVDTRLLNLSRDGMRLLRQIRETAK